MNEVEALEQRVGDLQERLVRLGEASLRANASLDFEQALQGVLDSACSLVEARLGLLTLRDGSGAVRNLRALGLGEEGPQELRSLPDDEVLLGYLRTLEEPLRTPDLHGHLRSLGLPEPRRPMAWNPAVSVLAVPVHHGAEAVGALLLGEREGGGEFSAADEETLSLFVPQVALAITNARRHREEQRSRADLENLIENSRVGVVVFDVASGTPVSSNQEVGRIIMKGLGMGDTPPAQLLAELTIRWADGTETTLEEAVCADALQNQKRLRAEEAVISAPNGAWVRTLINSTHMHSSDGERESVVVTIQDLTPLEELERLRAEFLATVSHELRGPLTSVKGSIANLLDGSVSLDPAEVVQFHRIIDAQTDRMRDLIRDLLDVARIETGTLPVEPKPADIAALVDEARTTFLSGGASANLQIELAPDLPWVMADGLRIVQVLNNLLANAARHAEGSGAIRVSVAREGIHVTVSVSDEGKGILPESLPQLFRKFSRIQTEEQGGDTGLGLAICKGIVEAHGGRIWAESEGPDRGATFTFTIPIATEAPATAGPALKQSSSGSSAADGEPCILVVDDDPQALRSTRDALSRAGYAPIVTGDPAEALRLAAGENPSLILLDLMLPGTDGITLMESIFAVAEVPIIFLSAYGQEDLVAKALDAGASDYIVKPFSRAELAARIRAALRRREAAAPTLPYRRGSLTVDFADRRVSLGDRPVRLTAKEYRTLAKLAADSGRVVTYEHLLRQVWGANADGDLRPMRTVINRLRRKLGDDSKNRTYIFTEHKVGYRMPRGEGTEPEGS